MFFLNQIISTIWTDKYNKTWLKNWHVLLGCDYWFEGIAINFELYQSRIFVRWKDEENISTQTSFSFIKVIKIAVTLPPSLELCFLLFVSLVIWSFNLFLRLLLSLSPSVSLFLSHSSLSFSVSLFLSHSFMIWVPELLSEQTGEAAGELGWTECQAVGMLKKKKKGPVWSAFPPEVCVRSFDFLQRHSI